MAERKAGEKPDSQTPACEGIVTLPLVDAPPLSPAEDTPAPLVGGPSVPAAAFAPVRFKLSLRHKRQTFALAAVALAAAFGALIGSLANNWGPLSHDVAGVEEQQAMQRSTLYLSRKVTLLKANLEKANAGARARQAEAPRYTGSITKTTKQQ